MKKKKRTRIDWHAAYERIRDREARAADTITALQEKVATLTKEVDEWRRRASTGSLSPKVSEEHAATLAEAHTATADLARAVRELSVLMSGSND